MASLGKPAQDDGSKDQASTPAVSPTASGSNAAARATPGSAAETADATRARFTDKCVAERPEMDPYCACSWAELRKRFTATDLADARVLASPRMAEARRTVVKLCGRKMPEQGPREAFLRSCAPDSSADRYCACTWDELKKHASPAEIEAGIVDQKTVFGRVDKICGALRP